MAIVFTCTFSHNRSLLWCAESVTVALEDFLLVVEAEECICHLNGLLQLSGGGGWGMLTAVVLKNVRVHSQSLLWVCWGCQAWESEPWGWLTADVSTTFAFVLANKCAVLVWLVFHTQVFFILTVTVYLDTIGCVVAELLSVFWVSGTKGYSFWQVLQVHVVQNKLIYWALLVVPFLTDLMPFLGIVCNVTYLKPLFFCCFLVSLWVL